MRRLLEVGTSTRPLPRCAPVAAAAAAGRRVATAAMEATPPNPDAAPAPSGGAGMPRLTSNTISQLDDYRVSAANIDASQIPDNMKKDCILFYSPDTETLARKIAAASSKVELGRIRWRCVFVLCFVCACVCSQRPSTRAHWGSHTNLPLTHAPAQQLCRRLPRPVYSGRDVDPQPACRLSRVLPQPRAHL